MQPLPNTVYERKFEVFGAEWTLDPDVPLDSINLRNTTQVRSLSLIAPPDQVNLYSIQMKAGEVFPPVVVWNDVLIDGNTRIHGARKAGLTSLPAYRVACRNEIHAKQIAASLNQTNGRRLNTEEAQLTAVTMMEDGYSDAFVARELGVEANKVRRWRKDKETREHADRLGLIDKVDGIAATTRSKLADITHDAPFKALVDTLDSYDIPTTDLNEVLDGVRKAASDDDAVRLVEERSEGWEPRGSRRRGAGPRTTAREANRSIGALLGKPVSYWVDLTVADEALPKWEALMALAEKVTAEYHRLASQAA